MFEFERQLAISVGARHAIAVSSDTALHLALEPIGIEAGDVLSSNRHFSPLKLAGHTSYKTRHAFRMIYRRYGKRLLDLSCAAAGLILLAPLLAGIALAVKCSSRGPVLFRQERVGRGGETFKIWKFRSMIVGADTMGPLITAAGDSRVNGIGGYLRRWKLDELPQLWNVLCGDMSLVGPRPELPLYVRDYTPAQRQVFMVRPGITDPAALQYRNEEGILAAAADRESFYKKVVLPAKLVLNLQYIQTFSLRFDLAIILRTLKAMFRPAPIAE